VALRTTLRVPAGLSARTRGRRPWDSFFFRVLAGSLLVSLPVLAVVGLLTVIARPRSICLTPFSRAITAAGEDVRLATEQQRSSTQQVVLAIEHIAEGSRWVAATAQEIASAAARQGELADDLARSGWESAEIPETHRTENDQKALARVIPLVSKKSRRRSPDAPGADASVLGWKEEADGGA